MSQFLRTTETMPRAICIENILNYFFPSYQAEITEYGTNVFGILPGRNWEQPTDRPLIIGAHWDSVSNTTGFDDNGSGVAVLLEIARVLSTAKVSAGGGSCFIPDHSIIFVAFDCEEPGSFGSIQVDIKIERLSLCQKPYLTCNHPSLHSFIP